MREAGSARCIMMFVWGSLWNLAGSHAMGKSWLAVGWTTFARIPGPLPRCRWKQPSWPKGDVVVAIK